MFDLTGKTALVTGASGGIGGSIAKTLAAQGAKIAVSGSSAEKLEKIASETGGVILPANLADKAAVEELAKQAEEKLGAVDILVCNAGITKDNLMMRMKDEEWESVLNVNLSSTFYLSRALMRGMIKRKFGRIINISSVVGVMGNAGQANYAASKAGMIGLTKSLAAECASRGVTANCIAPGFIETAMTDKLNAEQKERMMKNIPAGVFGKPEDIAAAALYLASPEASYITGQTLHVNGGMVMV